MEIKRDESSPNLGYALKRVKGIAHPDVRISPPPSGVRFERDVEVTVRDGTTLRVNVFLPPGSDKLPTIVCAHPYGKDVLPKPTVFGYMPILQYRILRQTGPVEQSAWTGWEAPDPAFWTAHGYAVVNVDLRGFGHSDGVGTLLSEQEAQDYYDVVEWVAAQPWSNGRVGTSGVSYLAISQWRMATLRPPHLAAISPWEGFTDVYRDFARIGGVREDGFLPIWSMGVKRGGRVTYDVREEQMKRPLWDDWWAARCPELEKIEVPALVCASFSDQGLHTRGSFEGFMRIGSQHKWLYTHRGGKWATYYSQEALDLQRRFFDCFLKGEENGMRDVPPVRLEVRSDRDTIRSVRSETSWPPADVRWTPLYLGDKAVLTQLPHPAETAVKFASNDGTASFVWQIAGDTEIAGPMTLQLDVSLEGCDDATLFAFVRKIHNGNNVPFEGSYGFGYDVVAKGWLKVSLRKMGARGPSTSLGVTTGVEEAARSFEPLYPFDESQPLKPGERVSITMEILPSATFFAKGDALQLDVRGRWRYKHRNPPILGPQFYEHGADGTIVLHCGGASNAQLLVPVIT